MDEVKRMNQAFCFDAEELRFETMEGKFFKGRYARAEDVPDNVGVLRSIKGRDNVYMFVMDFDGRGKNTRIIEAARLARLGLRNYFGIYSQIKDTTSKGLHVYARLKFPEDYEEEKILEWMRDAAYTVWSLMHLGDHPYKIGIGKNKDPPYIDMRMFEKGRLVRGFSRHPKTLEYPRHIDWEQRHGMLENYLELMEEKPLEKPLLKASVFDSIVQPRKWKRNTVVPVDAPDLLLRMPKRLQEIVLDDSDVGHDYKWGVVAWIYSETGWDPEQIAKWVWDNCKWEDLNDMEKTLYHTKWTCCWMEKSREQSGRYPMPRWIYD